MRRHVTIELGGQERPLALNLEAMACFEQETGTDLLDFARRLGDLGAAKRAKGKATPMLELRALVWALICGGTAERDEEPPTVRQVGSWIGPPQLADVMLKITEAIRASTNGMPETKAASEAEPVPQMVEASR